MIYAGVTHVTPGIEGRLLVLDIGGGSTECIIGRGHEPLELDSLYMGCVETTARFFGDGKLTQEAFDRARLAAGLELASIVERYRQVGWDRVLGSSGTILAVSEVLRQQGWASGTITADALEKLDVDVIGLSAMTYEAGCMHELAREMKRRLPETKIVCGGPHPSVAAEDVMAAPDGPKTADIGGSANTVEVGTALAAAVAS